MAIFTNPDNIHRASVGAIAPAPWGDAVNDDINFLYGDTGWSAPTFTNSWVNWTGGSAPPAGFRLIGTRVVLRGTIASGTINTVAFTLPAGYRPTASVDFAVISNGAIGWLGILTTGVVTPVSGSNVRFALDGVTFDTI